jgi:hypothetical protein
MEERPAENVIIFDGDMNVIAGQDLLRECVDFGTPIKVLVMIPARQNPFSLASRATANLCPSGRPISIDQGSRSILGLS